MIHSTKGIVLKTVKYGETSIIVSIFTELFGVQSYLVNGVRTSGKTAKAHFFQPSSILEMQVYHNDLKNLQRIKDIRWSTVYRNILSDVIKNTVALFMVELLQKSLKQPETHIDLFYFCEDSFLHLDKADENITGNFPGYFALQLAPFLGFRIQDNYSESRNTFNAQEGYFTEENISGLNHLSPEISYHISQLLKAIHPEDLGEISINRSIRRMILKSMESFYAWHIQDFGTMKTLPVLSEILS